MDNGVRSGDWEGSEVSVYIENSDEVKAVISTKEFVECIQEGTEDDCGTACAVTS